MSTCGTNCDIAQATFEYEPIAGSARMYDEGDIVTMDIEETEFNEHTSHDGQSIISAYKSATMVDVTVMLFPCDDWYRDLYDAWSCNKGLCGGIIVNDPCCDVRYFRNARIKKMGVKPVSHDNPATEVIFSAYLPLCDAAGVPINVGF